MKKRNGKRKFQEVLRHRERPLPWEHPKAREDDAQAEKRVKAIMAHSNFIQADLDPDFLRRDEVRGVRLEVDYLSRTAAARLRQSYARCRNRAAAVRL